jgi:hypothetical protein
MYTRLTAIAATAATLIASAAPAAAKERAFDPLTGGYSPASGMICVRSGWGIATQQTGRSVRAGDCRKADAWRTRGIVFDLPRPTVDAVELAAR